MTRRHHSRHRNVLRDSAYRNLKVGSIIFIIAIVIIRVLTWIYQDKSPGFEVIFVRVVLIIVIIAAGIGGIILLRGLMRWMKFKSGL